jgi:hypothetical protein
MRVWAAVALSLFLLLPLLVVGPSAPPPPPRSVADENGQRATLLPPPHVEPDYRDAVYGDLTVVGNSVLRCPTLEEDPASGACVAATGGTPPSGAAADNNGYRMRLASTGDSFATSTARLTVPAGARVRYAQLNWGGHTGQFLGFSGFNCVRPLGLPSEPPPAPAAARPADQDVRIAVGGGAPARVPRVPEHFRLTAGLLEPSQMYTDWADVTARFADAPAGTPLEVAVSDVWAPSGTGCAGGWSLVVVFDFGAPTAEYPAPRAVDVYSGTLPQGGALVPGLLEPLLPGFPSAVDALLPDLVPDLGGTHVLLDGPSPARGEVTLGVTAFDGDRRHGTERFSVDGTAVTEPCDQDGADDFFRSCAAGAVDGDREVVNNLSVDAKSVRVSLPPNETGEVDIGVDGIDDFVVVQSVALSAPVDPGIDVTVTGPATPVREGDLAEFAVAVRNTGGLPLRDLTLTGGDPAMRCTPAEFAPIQSGATAQATCVVPARVGAGPQEVTATAAYLVSSGGDSRTVSATGSDDVVVLPAEYTVSRVPDRLTVHAGEPVEFAVTLADNTDGDLTGVTYTDSATTQCTAPPAVLTAHGTASLRCVVPAATETFESAGTMTGTDVTGAEVTVHSQSVVIGVIAPAVTITQSVDPAEVYRGSPVTASFVVTNTGGPDDGPLLDATITAPLPGCVVPPVAELAPGESVTVDCTATPVETTDFAATVSATDSAGAPVTATADPARVTVLDPVLALTQAASPNPVRAGESVTFTFTATNTAAAGPLHQVRIASPTLPPSCAPAEIPALAPGESQSRTCTVPSERSFTNAAAATALDATDRPMTTTAEPLPVTVLNPALTVSVTANPDRAKHSADVDFEVTLRNLGNVDLAVDLTNDRAADCDVVLPALVAGTAHGVRCTVRMPSAESAAEFTNQVTYTARPIPDTGPPLTGTETATVTLLAGQAPPEPEPGTDPENPPPDNDPGDSGNSDNSGSGNGSSGDESSEDDDSGGLAYTGLTIVLPLVLGLGLLTLGTMAIVTTRRRRHTTGT